MALSCGAWLTLPGTGGAGGAAGAGGAGGAPGVFRGPLFLATLTANMLYFATGSRPLNSVFADPSITLELLCLLFYDSIKHFASFWEPETPWPPPPAALPRWHPGCPPAVPQAPPGRPRLPPQPVLAAGRPQYIHKLPINRTVAIMLYT